MAPIHKCILNIISLLIPPIVLAEEIIKSEDLLIQTGSGKIQGKIVKTMTENYGRAFFGIPYAEAPVGGLRFKPPVPVSPWSGVLDATRNARPCYQHHTSESLKSSRRWGKHISRPWSEDCLTLDIWTPGTVPFDAPVVIYIHGGGFSTGAGGYPYLDFSTHTFNADIVWASVNYRLGAFGFLTFGTTDAPGNLGLMDQILAVKWIKDNAIHFGGKSEAVFLFGIGAASASIGFHVIYEGNQGLFKTGVLYAGAPTCTWSWDTKENAVGLAKNLSSKLGCQNWNESEELECMQRKHPEDILDASRIDIVYRAAQFKPYIDGVLIKEPPLESMKMGRFNKNNLIVFHNANDASLTFYNLNEDLLSGQDPGLTRNGFREAMRRVGLGRSKTELDAIEEWYLKEGCLLSPTEIRDAAVTAYSDGLFVCCTQQFLDYATLNGAVSYNGVFGLPDPRLPDWMGAERNGILSFLTAATLDPKNNFSEEVKLATFDISYVAKVYLRKKAVEFQELIPLYNMEDKPYLFWGKKRVFMNKFKIQDCILWDKIIPQLREGRKTFNVCPVED